MSFLNLFLAFINSDLMQTELQSVGSNPSSSVLTILLKVRNSYPRLVLFLLVVAFTLARFVRHHHVPNGDLNPVLSLSYVAKDSRPGEGLQVCQLQLE